MLAKILEDMCVEPEILEALSEEQRRILFLKMREEQVRRWREREEKDERDNPTRTKKVSSKHVSWMLGQDGDVSVNVIGDVGNFSSSKLNSLLNNKLHSASMHAIQRRAVLPGEVSQHAPLTDSISVMLNEHSSEEEMDTGSAEDDLRDPVAEDDDSESGSIMGNLKDQTRLNSHGNEAFKSQLSDAGRTHPQPKVDGQEEEPSCLGRVAQLRRAFASDPSYTKPPVPNRPLHLQRLRAPLYPLAPEVHPASPASIEHAMSPAH